VTGNGQGSAGFAIGRAPPETGLKAVARGLVSASRKLVYIDLLEGRTIYHDFFAECNCTRLFVQRRSAGYGLSCHPRLIKVCQVSFFLTPFLHITTRYLPANRYQRHSCQSRRLDEQLLCADKSILHRSQSSRNTPTVGRTSRLACGRTVANVLLFAAYCCIAN
jgi:hypothetical protein